MKKHEKYVKRALELGFTGAKIIRADSIVTAAWVRLKCRYGCSGYGLSHCCPPKSPAPDETRAIVDEYKRAILLHSKGDYKPMKSILKLENEIFFDGYEKAFGYGCGPCGLCKTCNLEGCVHPESARPSMEASGIDVFSTARDNGFTINVLRSRDDEVNLYGLILIE